MKREQKKNLLIACFITILACALVLSGFYAGKWAAKRSLKQVLNLFDSAATLGYLDPDELNLNAYEKKPTPEDLDYISWAPMNVPAPFVQHVPRPGHRFNTNINSLGMRSTREAAGPWKADTIRIFITGGSTAYCSGAPSQETTISGLLESFLNNSPFLKKGFKYEVYTAANPAWSSTHERIYIENIISELSPDLVISFSGNNDVHWGYEGENIFWFWSYYDRYTMNVLNTAHRFVGNPLLYDVVPKPDGPVRPDLVARRLLKNVNLAFYALSLAGSRYVFILQPTRRVTEFIEPAPEDEQKLLYFRECYEYIRRNLGEFQMADFYFLDYSKMFDGLKSADLMYIDSYHFGDKGNRMIAEKIGRFLIENNLVQ